MNLLEYLFYILHKIGNKIKPNRYLFFKSVHSILNKSNIANFKTKYNKKYYIFKQNNDVIYVRKKGSDLFVFKQVILDGEYSTLIKLLIDNEIKVDFIIDAGSNIGLTSLLFLNNFQNATTICLEPDMENYETLKLNLHKFIATERCIAIQKALWSSEKILELSNDFRDGQEWSRAVKNQQIGKLNNVVNSTTINILTKEFNINEISILKIDIEGSEGEIFGENSDYKFLKIVKVIAIEIHDEVVNRNKIYKILKNFDFLIFNAGEITIGINKNLIQISQN